MKKKSENLWSVKINLMAKLILKNKWIFIALLALVVAVPLLVFGYDANTGARAAKNYTTKLEVNSASGVIDCRVLNSTNVDYFVPTKTIGEWNAFASVAPSLNLTAGCCDGGACQGSVSETCANCDSDCGSCYTAVCGNGYCETSLGETSGNCAYDCPMGCCQRTVATADCPSIPYINQCQQTPSCAWNTGMNRCEKAASWGSECWSSADQSTCNIYYADGCVWNGAASRCDHYCGDGSCDPIVNESYLNCLQDCAAPPGAIYCGDNICNNGETCNSCQNDCGPCPYCGDGICNNGEDSNGCPGDCGGGLGTNCQGAGYCSTYSTELRCLKNPGEGCTWSMNPS